MSFSQRWGETLLGAVVAAVAVGFFAFAAAQAGQTGVRGDGYDLIARFDSASGIAVGADVRISGVKVGIVREVDLDPDTFMARVTMNIRDDVRLLDDSSARIMSDGLLGGAYVAIEPAGLEPLAPGAEIPHTQGAVDVASALVGLVNMAAENNAQNEGPNP